MPPPVAQPEQEEDRLPEEEQHYLELDLEAARQKRREAKIDKFLQQQEALREKPTDLPRVTAATDKAPGLLREAPEGETLTLITPEVREAVDAAWIEYVKRQEEDRQQQDAEAAQDRRRAAAARERQQQRCRSPSPTQEDEDTAGFNFHPRTRSSHVLPPTDGELQQLNFNRSALSPHNQLVRTVESELQELRAQERQWRITVASPPPTRRSSARLRKAAALSPIVTVEEVDEQQPSAPREDN